MKVVIVEDDDEKRATISSFLEDHFSVSELLSARSLQSGLRLILGHPSDVVILDMTMRNFDRSLEEEGGRPHPFAGREILRQMRRNRVSTPVIVVTHFDRFGEEKDYMTLEQLKRELEAKFSNYVGAVHYRGNVDSWKPELLAAVSSVVVPKPEIKH